MTQRHTPLAFALATVAASALLLAVAVDRLELVLVAAPLLTALLLVEVGLSLGYAGLVPGDVVFVRGSAGRER